MTDQGLRDAGIHAIHAHVVAIIGSPAQSQLRKVAGAYHHTAHLVGKIHQNLCTLACLRILIGYIMHAGIMTDILKMLGHRLGDADFPDGNAQTLHQRDGIIICSIGGSETWHGNTHDATAVHLQLIECLHADEQGKGGIQSAADTHYHRLGMGMYDALGKTHQLDIENLLAGGIHIAAGRNERMRIHLTLQHELAFVLGRIGIDVTDVELSAENRIFDVTLGVDIGGICATFRTEFLHINLCDNHLRIKRETLTLCK